MLNLPATFITIGCGIMQKPAIIIVDMINDFLEKDGKLFCRKCWDIVPNVKKLAEVARNCSVPVIFTNCCHPSGDKTGDILKWPLHAVVGTKGAEIIDDLKPKKGDYIIGKKNYSGFYHTDLDKILNSLAVDSLVITGIHTHVCVLATGLDAFYRGYTVIFPEDCVATDKKADHRAGLRFFKSQLGEVTSLNKLINDLTTAGTRSFRDLAKSQKGF
jgi:nicotinamidase-related amidase